MGDDSKALTVRLASKFSGTASDFIQDDKHRDLLDIIDKLRLCGVSNYIELPQIIVCGSQSSGKSSTLESISGVPFPTAEGLCTRFATELILRRCADDESPQVSVQIIPAKSRTEDERETLATFGLKSSHFGDVGDIIEGAKVAMGLTGAEGAKKFCDDVLRIECSSPDQPNLTIVDLPGLFGAADKNQSDEDAAMVQELVTSYMRQRRSIILAVVSADVPFTNQPVTKFAREIDPKGIRTLGLITKPDRLDVGSESERYYLDLAQNRNVKLKLGWHVLRNRGYDTRKETSEERDARERAFFADSAWRDLESSQLGVQALRERLREVLWHQIQVEMPRVKSDVGAGIADCRSKLLQLGKARDTQKERRDYLMRISTQLHKVIKEAIDGVYADRFFESLPGQTDAFDRRLRAHVQLILDRYAAEMNRNGHRLEIVEDGKEPTRASSFIMRATYIDTTVRTAMAECRGRELPGNYNPMVVGDLFSRQCKPWEGITQQLVEEIHGAALATFNTALSEICDQNTKDLLMRHLVQQALHSLRSELKQKVADFLEPHLSVHPITYNDDLVFDVRDMQAQRYMPHFNRLVKSSCLDLDIAKPKDGEVKMSQIVRALEHIRKFTEPDIEGYSASLATDTAAAYYAVALKKFIDDISVNAVETSLVQKLPDVFSPQVLWQLCYDHPDRIDILGAESEKTVRERAELTEMLRVLEEGLRELDAFTARSGGWRSQARDYGRH
ncbi:hypothetical protein MAPG_05670 [Magnaporthiopsis poae ATCC 64411]|uniref:Interferon-induced GTP-binding protein Mx n=1 Tax=Magnaporthiopsis poae (strain ATCC 64411 / 73-15) TaxID=644358 RepID=A0A0C4E005_MAGP6|nr:hypothetical protein MAPG_05670 [Magnaporthiopsis poae ATCC 64411]